MVFLENSGSLSNLLSLLSFDRFFSSLALSRWFVKLEIEPAREFRVESDGVMADDESGFKTDFERMLW